jgi:hypothetical protein
MADSPYKTLAGVLQADQTGVRELFFYHTSRHQCRAGECEVREAFSLARDIVGEWLEREKAGSSSAPERSERAVAVPHLLRAGVDLPEGAPVRAVI